MRSLVVDKPFAGTEINEEMRFLAHGLMEAIIRGDCDLAAQVFHDGATVTGMMDGVLIRSGVADYMEHCRKMRFPRRAIHRRYRIMSGASVGAIGFMGLAEFYPDSDVISYNTLSKINGTWKINNRTLLGREPGDFAGIGVTM